MADSASDFRAALRRHVYRTSPERVAEAVGVHRATVYRWLDDATPHGQRRRQIEAMMRLARVAPRMPKDAADR